MNRYKKLQKKAQKLRAKKKMCTDKVTYDSEEEAFQKGQIVYKCKYCNKYHRSGQFASFIAKLIRK